jgi:hypothetical protein
MSALIRFLFNALLMVFPKLDTPTVVLQHFQAPTASIFQPGTIERIAPLTKPVFNSIRAALAATAELSVSADFSIADWGLFFTPLLPNMWSFAC